MGWLSKIFKAGTKRKPLVLVLLFSFWIGYMALGTAQYVYELNRILENDNLERFKRVDHEKYLSSTLLATLEIDTLLSNLNRSLEARNFDFYILRENGKVISFFNPGFTIEEVEKWHFPKDQSIAKDGSVAWRRIDVRGLELVIGIQMRGSEFALAVIQNMKKQIILDFVLVSILFFALVYLVLKDILDLTQVLKSRGKRNASNVKVLSDEAKVLVSVANEYEKVSNSLKISGDVFSASLSPAVRHELTNKTQAPHQFDALVVRIDVNGYTQLSLERKPEFVTHLLNQYFHRAGEVIHRFGGHIYQYVGDEIVFHFKIENEKEGVVGAVSCVRALFEIAEDLHRDLESERVLFFVKASMASGKMRFVNLDTGYAFAGIPLIESVRMLGGVDDKSANVLILNQSHFNMVGHLAGDSKRISTYYKGFAEQKELIEIKSFLHFSPKITPTSEWGAWRSDRNLVDAMNVFLENLENVERTQILNFISYFRAFPIESVSGAVATAYCNLLSAALKIERTSSQKDVLDLLFASLVHLSTKFLRGAVLNESIRQSLENLLNHPNPRVKANAILALDELSPETYSFREMFDLPSNRAAADALIAEGRREYSTLVHSCLLDFISSKDPFFVASGIYVMAYLYEYHAKRDSIYLAANSRFSEIPSIIEKFVNDENFMVSRRALIAKGQLEELNAA